MNDSTYPASITVDPRFCGPPGSANGGYVAGRLAAFLPGGAEVTLRRPPPLGRPLPVSRHADGRVLLLDGDELLGEAKPGSVDATFPDPPGVAMAERAAGRSFDAALHRIPGCFVCGPGREHGDGLRLHPGPVDAGDTDWTGLLATTWRPGADLVGGNGEVRPEFIWAALDCPTAYACASAAGMLPILLGRQTVVIDAFPQAGQTCVIVSFARGQEGRKHFADAALFTDDGMRLACCRAVWIEVTEAQLRATSEPSSS